MTALDDAGWERVVDAARWHRLTPLLFRRLAGVPDVPAPVLERLEAAYLANVARNLLLTQTLTTVLEQLEAADVPAVPLKGAALIETVYPDPGLRELLDLDLLVPLGRIATAQAALRAAGFEPDTREIPPEHHYHAAALLAPDRRTAVELHHHLATGAEAARFDIETLWRRTRVVGGTPSRLVSPPADLLLHVAIHFTRNRMGARTGGALAQIGDIAWLAGTAAIDWESLVHDVRDYALETRVFLALWCAAELGVPIPVDVLSELRPTAFDPAIGHQFLLLRVLRTDEHQLVRSLRRMIAPERTTLVVGWKASSDRWPALAQAYARRARVRVPDVAASLRRPLRQLREYRLNGQIDALERGD